MVLKTFKLRKKLLCGILTSVFAVGLVSLNYRGLAMIDENADSTSSSAQNAATINTPDDQSGKTPLMKAIDDFDVEQVKYLLSHGATLEVPKLYKQKLLERDMADFQIYGNVFEYLCDKTFCGETRVAVGILDRWAPEGFGGYTRAVSRESQKETNFAAGEKILFPEADEECSALLDSLISAHIDEIPKQSENPTSKRCEVARTPDLDPELVSRVHGVVDAILDYCVAKKVQLKINPCMFVSKAFRPYFNVWKLCGRDEFAKYVLKYPELFQEHPAVGVSPITHSGTAMLMNPFMPDISVLPSVLLSFLAK